MRIASVNFKKIKANKIWRLEAEFYNRASLIKSNFVIGEDAIDFVQYGTSEELNESGLGYPVLRLNEFDSLFIKNPDKYCNKIDFEIFKNLSLKKDDVLICRTNGNPKLVGKSALVPMDYDVAFASYLFRVRPKKSIINSATLAIYLNGKIGRAQIEKNLMISNQANFSPAKFKEIQIPILGINIQRLIEKIVYLAFEKLRSANTAYSEAENLLLQELGLLNWKPKHRLSFIKNFSDTQSSDRTDAEYFQPMYEEIEKLISKYERGFDSVGNQFKQNKKSFKRMPDKDYKYIEISCINVSDGNMTPMTLKGDELPANAKIKFSSNDTIVSKVRPYRGAIGIVTSNDYVGSGAFTVLQENGAINKETLFVFLRSKPMLAYSLKFNTGTSYPTITDDDILNFPLPLIDEVRQKQIKAMIEEGINTKYISKRLLDIAKRGVEIAIEKTEKDAQEWIDAELGKLDIRI